MVQPAPAAPSCTKNEASTSSCESSERPEREHVEARERHVPRADHERDAEVAERADQERRDGEEDHDRARAS